MYAFTVTMVVLLAIASIFSITASLLFGKVGKQELAGRAAISALIKLSLMSWGLTTILNGVA